MTDHSDEDIELDSSPSNKKMVDEIGEERVGHLLDKEEDDPEVEKRQARTEEMNEEEPSKG